MVAQRALDYREVETEYILFLDDDVYLPPDGVEYLFNAMKQYDGDVISPDVFNNAGRSTKQEIPLLFMNRKDTPVELCGKDGVYRMLTTDHTTPMNF